MLLAARSQWIHRRTHSHVSFCQPKKQTNKTKTQICSRWGGIKELPLRGECNIIIFFLIEMKLTSEFKFKYYDIPNIRSVLRHQQKAKNFVSIFVCFFVFSFSLSFLSFPSRVLFFSPFVCVCFDCVMFSISLAVAFVVFLHH